MCMLYAEFFLFVLKIVPFFIKKYGDHISLYFREGFWTLTFICKLEMYY